MEPEFSICLALKLVFDSIIRFTATPPKSMEPEFWPYPWLIFV